MVKIELTSFSHFQETKVVLKCLNNIFRTITCLHIVLGSFNFGNILNYQSGHMCGWQTCNYRDKFVCQKIMKPGSLCIYDFCESIAF